MEVNFKTTKIVMSLMGCWPFQNRALKIFMKFFSIFSFVCLHIAQICALYTGRYDFELTVKRIPLIIMGFVYYVHLLFFIIQGPKINHLLSGISKDFKTLKPFLSEMKILTRSTDEGRFIVATYALYIMTTAIVYSIAVITPAICNIFLNENKTMETYYLYDVDYVVIDCKNYYFLTNIHGFIGGSFSVVGVITSDIILYTLIQHSCGLFQVLMHRIKNISNIMNNENKWNIKRKDQMFEKVVDCLNLYGHVLDYSQKINECFSTFLFFSTGIIVALMSFQGLMLIKNINNIEFVMKFSSIALGQTLHLLSNCVPGQKLLDYSSNIFYCIYEINWYEMPISIQKMLLLMMNRSLRESKIMVGTLVVFSIETYSSLMKLTFSYLSVLNSMK
ncbi:uncharacterized protein LOC127285022 [Leptopilina boulardi]|uniref:uncharacterized protein LOC127285022 n=1 Tax=Leptopilina boulardi TaxID=63433 RepID=UPI0021F5A877|nr:uncharacterized protein LOC127285022 [Leptopilina boulardi]